MMSRLMQDVRVAARAFRQRPGFAVAAALTLAVGIGANLTVFSIVNALLLRPLPFGERSDRVVMLFSTHAQQHEDWNWGDSGVSYRDLRDLAGAEGLDGLGGYLSRNFTLSHDGAAERVQGGSVTPDLFPLLGVQPALGRHFRPEEAAPPGLESVVMLTHGLWQRRYGGTPDIIGRQVYVNQLPRTVVGVMPPGFRFPERDDLYLPLRQDEAPRDARGLNAVGLLRPGTSLAQAQDALSAAAARLARDYPDTNRGFGVHVVPFRDAQVDAGARGLSGLLMAAVAVVLLIACANLTNLLLARAAGRRREMAVRAALGAGRVALVRQVLVEAALLTGTGAVAGLVAAVWLVDYLRGSFPEDLPYWLRFEPDGRVALFLLAVSAATTVAVGLVPALRASRPELVEDLKDATRATASRSQQRLQTALVAAQVAVCLALLTGASMTVRGVVAMQTEDLGFDHQPLLSWRVYLAGDEFDPGEARARRLGEIVEAVRALPGVDAATATTSIPGDDGGGSSRVVVDGRSGPDDAVPVQIVAGIEQLFDTLAVRLVEGRDFTQAEVRDPDARVALINATLARQLFAPGQAVGRRVGVPTARGVTWYRVLGVAPDLHYEEVGEETEASRRIVYLPHAAAGGRTAAVLARTTDTPDGHLEQVRAMLADRFPEQPVFELMTMRERRRFVAWEYRFMVQMMTAFALVALALAAFGVYALLAYAVRQRFAEIGVRLALGAHPRDVERMFLAQGLSVTGGGAAAGLVLAALVAGALDGLFFGVEAWSPGHFVLAAGVLAATALAASYVPARRAARTDPSTALRAD